MGSEMNESPIRAYLSVLKREFRLAGLFDRDDLEEIEDHLLDAVQAGLRQGLTREDAERRALARFGRPRVVVASYIKGKGIMLQKICFGLALLAGLFSVFVDSRPTWDDTGVLVFGILLAAGLIGLFTRRQPWLFGLAVGVWIPLYEIIAHHHAGSLIALGFALLGVYAGWALGQGFRRLAHPA